MGKLIRELRKEIHRLMEDPSDISPENREILYSLANTYSGDGHHHPSTGAQRRDYRFVMSLEV